MKKYTLLISIIMILVSCSKNETLDIVNPLVIVDNNKLLMLKVDYLTSTFEGGTELNFNSVGFNDSIPMNIVYNAPGDFGDLFIEHIPTGDSIFFGTIVWSGLGERIFPETLWEPADFDTSAGDLEFPTDLSIKYINGQFDEFGELIDFSQIWNVISPLNAVQNYLDNGAHLALLKYTPSVGIGDPGDADWYVMLYL